MLDLNDIVVFARVVEAGSFTAAARLLAMPKTTVSRRVAALERELGVRLLQRTTRSLN
ncbi:MAG: LysR family transcriptional regulator, partial [Mesorhizobium sp.]